MPVIIQNARPEDREAVGTLLEQAHLLTDDLPADLTDFVLAKTTDGCVGVAGLERFGPVALLRSVAVAPTHQGRHIAARLVGHLLETAAEAGLSDLFLITTTADGFFARHGFQPVDRQTVPVAIRQTRQFSELCPASAVVMKRAVDPGGFLRHPAS
ncbi:arsenic resistance N-acetyltransferase ArsN2 [Larkinella insperata]|uniref:Arsenic resistance N-acetyltransferase ArsN2 n=1 Tax=Larkinella insperata TaxID=332158 RepID=A0ABW3QMV9_9BACT|nr:arsenic resistance N-acetyltransferase ArsN2 [Larkinella insperata]